MLTSYLDSISYISSNFFYYIEKIFLKIIDILLDAFDIFSGNMFLDINIPKNLFLDVALGNTIISFIIWGFAVFGILLLLNVILKKKTARKKAFSLIFSFIIISTVLVSTVNVTNYLENKIISLIDDDIVTSNEISFTDEEYATMYRILVKIGNYSLNDSSFDTYNINSCFNEIRSDLVLLEESGFFNYDYVLDGLESSWQEEISKIGRSADLSKDLQITEENPEVSSAITSCIKQIRENASFRPLKNYKADVLVKSYDDSITSNLIFRTDIDTIDAFDIYDLVLVFGLGFVIIRLFLLLINCFLKLLNLFGLYAFSANTAKISVKNDRNRSIYLSRISLVVFSLILMILFTKIFTIIVDFIFGETFNELLILLLNYIGYTSAVLQKSIKIALLLIFSIVFSRIAERITDLEYNRKDITSLRKEAFKKLSVLDMYVLIVSIIILIVFICSTIEYKPVFITIHIIISIELLCSSYGTRNYLCILYWARFVFNRSSYDRLNKDKELFDNKEKGSYTTAIDGIFTEENSERFNSLELSDIISYTGLKDAIISFNNEYYCSVVEFKYSENTTRHLNKIINSLKNYQFLNIIRLKKSYYLAIFDKSIEAMGQLSYSVISELQEAYSSPQALSGKDLAVFLKNFSLGEYKAETIDNIKNDDYGVWSMPSKLTFITYAYNLDGKTLAVKRVNKYPDIVKNSGYYSEWLTKILALNGEKVVIKIWPNRKYNSKIAERFLERIKLFKNNQYIFDTFVTSYTDDKTDENYGFGFDYLYYNQLEGFISSELSEYDRYLNYI